MKMKAIHNRKELQGMDIGPVNSIANYENEPVCRQRQEQFTTILITLSKSFSKVWNFGKV